MAAGLDSVRFWRNLLYALTGAALILFLKDAFLLPGTLSYAPYTIQDDARQFLAWMPRIADPNLMPGDLIADYWQSVSPPLYRWCYQAAAAIGIPPLVFARLLPVPLIAICAWASWRLALQLTGRPLAAFVAAGALMALVIHEDSAWSATPRAFSPPLFLLFADALVNRRRVPVVISLVLLGCFYPPTALVGFGMLCLSLVRVRPRFGIDLSRRSMVLVPAAGLAVLAAMLPLEAQTAQWKPILTVAQAEAMPNLGSPDGRSRIVNSSGNIGWMCSSRMGLLPEIIPCWATRAAGPANFLLLLPMLVLAWRAALRWDERPPELIYSWTLISGLAWWCIAFLVAFKLHVPGRYTQRVLSPLEWLAIGQFAGRWLDIEWRRGNGGAPAVVGAALLAGLMLVSFAMPTPGLWQPSDPGAIERIRALPANAMIAGIANDMSFVPALTGHPALVSAEHAVPYHFGYYRPLEQRFHDTLIAAASADPAVLADYIRRYRIAAFAAEPELLARGRVAPLYAGLLPATVKAAEAAMARRPSALQRLAPACAFYRGSALVLLSGPCLAERAAAEVARPDAPPPAR